jgi:hypothetical protein
MRGPSLTRGAAYLVIRDAGAVPGGLQGESVTHA